MAGHCAAEAISARMSKPFLLYEKPVVLNRETHRGLRLRTQQPDFGFARQTNSIPLAGVEFAMAAGCYPIVFAGARADDLVACALLGLRADENLWIDADGTWKDGYVPAFVRRYPFVLANKPDGDGFHVCVDAACAGFGAQDGEPLFDENGADSPMLHRALTFLQEFQGHLERTRDFVSRVAGLDLFKPQVVKVVPAGGGDPYFLRDFHVVDEERLRALDDADLQRLFRAGDLAWIYAHLISLSRIPALQRALDRRLEQAGGKPAARAKSKRKRKPSPRKASA